MPLKEIINRLKHFWDASTKRVVAYSTGGEVIAAVPTKQAIEVADLILRCFQIGIAAVTLAYLALKLYRAFKRPTEREKLGD